jgi:hypothetical protein
MMIWALMLWNAPHSAPPSPPAVVAPAPLQPAPVVETAPPAMVQPVVAPALRHSRRRPEPRVDVAAPEPAPESNKARPGLLNPFED